MPCAGVLCLIDDVSAPEVELSPVKLDDYYIDPDNKLNIGREHFKHFIELFLNPGRLDMDLNEGFDQFVPAPIDHGLSQVEQYIEWRSNKLRSNDLRIITGNADVVCKRRSLAKLAGAPYESRSGWKFLVSKFEDILFISEYDGGTTEEAKSEFQSRATYWGHSFEAKVFKKKGTEPNFHGPPVLSDGKTCAVFSTTFESRKDEEELKLFYTGEIHGLDSAGKYVQAKTQAHSLFDGLWFENKAMKWYVQNKLVGMEDVIVGFRTSKGRLTKVEKVNLDYLDDECKEWSKDVCFATVQHVLNRVRRSYDYLVGPDEVLIVEGKPGAKFVLFEVVSSEKETVLSTRFQERFRSQTSTDDEGY